VLITAVTEAPYGADDMVERLRQDIAIQMERIAVLRCHLDDKDRKRESRIGVTQAQRGYPVPFG
jgi:hypothetical protein